MGKAVACQLSEKGANVVIVARTLKKLQVSIEGVKVGCLIHALFAFIDANGAFYF